MKKMIAIVALLIVSCSHMAVSAAAGTIEMEVPKEAGEITVCYTKVAEFEEMQQEEVHILPKENVEYEKQIKFKNLEDVRLENIEEGIYQIQLLGENGYEFSTVVVSVPMWNESEQLMENYVRIIPKYVVHLPEPEEPPKEESPQTGDGNKVGKLIIFVMFSLLIVIMSCHKRFKCARMSE